MRLKDVGKGPVRENRLDKLNKELQSKSFCGIPAGTEMELKGAFFEGFKLGKHAKQAVCQE